MKSFASSLPAHGPPPVPTPTVAPRRRRRAAAITAIAAGALIVGTLASASHDGRRAHRDDPDTESMRAVLRLPAKYRSDTSAYGSYLRGLALRFEFNFRASRDTFAALARRDPTYVPGLFGLAHAYALMATNALTDPDEAWPRVEQAARTAVALDSTAASGWLALAAADLHWHQDLERARQRIARGRMLDSLDPDGPAMQSVLFRFQGQMDSAVIESRRAVTLDPLSRYFARLHAKQLYFARRYEQCAIAYAKLLGDDPGWTRGYEDFAVLHRVMGRPRDAVDWYRRARAAAGDSAGAALLPHVATDSAAARLLAADARRQIARMDRLRRSGERVPPLRYASTYAALRDTAATLRWLDSVAAQKDAARYHVRVDPIFDFIRGSSCYRAWEARLHLATRPAH